MIPYYIFLAIRGVVIDGACQDDFKGESEAKLREQYEGKPIVKFCNDVQGMAEGVINRSGYYFIRLMHGKSTPASLDVNYATSLLFTMGTGTGMSIIYSYQGKPLVLPTETWASQLSVDMNNPRQVAAGDYLNKVKRTKANLMKFLKGPALLTLYTFMQSQHPELYTGVEKKIKKALKKERPKDALKTPIGVPECVTHAAVYKQDELCTMTIEFLVEIMACALQTMALTFLPGAIYISGGVANYLSSFIKEREDLFWQHFLNHA